MATPEVTIHPSPAQGSAVSANPTPRETPCSYCQRQIAKRILAARKPYCGKLCAAMGLIVDEYENDGIDDGFGSIEALLDSVFYEGPRAYPVKVRDSDAEKFWRSDERPDWHEVIVVIDDDGTPDWIPDPILDADQDEIDYAVDKFLLSQGPFGEEEVRP